MHAHAPPAERPTAAYLYGTCLVDAFDPGAGLAAAELLAREGVRVVFPQGQTCCGQPAWTTGFHDEARAVARAQLDLFPEPWPVVIPSGSCAAMFRVHYPQLFRGTPDAAKAEALAERCWEFGDFLLNVLGVRLEDCGPPRRVAIHTSCHARRELGLDPVARALVGQLANVEVVDVPHATECCGFGGTFSVRHPDISAAMVRDKTAALTGQRPHHVVSADCGCLLNIGGALDAQRSGTGTRHLATFLLERTRDEPGT